MGIISLVGVVVGIELSLRVVDYLYTCKTYVLGSLGKCCIGSHKKIKRRCKVYNKNYSDETRKLKKE
jgi:hypothetical protein